MTTPKIELVSFSSNKPDLDLYDLESDPELQMTVLQSNRKRIKIVWIFIGSFIREQYNRKWVLLGF